MRSTTLALLCAALLILACAALPACTTATSIHMVRMDPGADVTVSIQARTATLQVRNTGNSPADISIESDRRITSPPEALPPNGTWRQDFTGNVDLVLHNRGENRASLQLFTPSWNYLRIVLFPDGRQKPEAVVPITEESVD